MRIDEYRCKLDVIKCTRDNFLNIYSLNRIKYIEIREIIPNSDNYYTSYYVNGLKHSKDSIGTYLAIDNIAPEDLRMAIFYIYPIINYLYLRCYCDWGTGRNYNLDSLMIDFFWKGQARIYIQNDQALYRTGTYEYLTLKNANKPNGLIKVIDYIYDSTYTDMTAVNTIINNQFADFLQRVKNIANADILLNDLINC